MKFMFIIALTTIATKKNLKVTASHREEPQEAANEQYIEDEEMVEGYYRFLQAKNTSPPKVKPPPYFKSPIPCPGMEKPYLMENTLSNICGDLNKGAIPENPMNHEFNGMPYPFELITNKTLEFLKKTLPILQNDETVPRVINYINEEVNLFPAETKKQKRSRVKREESAIESTLTVLKQFLLESTDVMNITRRAREYCENGNGMICLLYKAIQGEKSDAVERELNERKGEEPPSLRLKEPEDPSLPPTPCPAKIEYATPVFARNYQGIWRYVVQIPYEGYFTQTVEITKCLNSRCHYIEGKCLSSPRWVSFLVAELYYPENEEIHSANKTDTIVCDGTDKNGCYQVRLYYDWFLVPGSCKCWRPEYLQKYVNS